MSYIPLTLAPDENVFIRDRFNLILAAFCVYANCTWFEAYGLLPEISSFEASKETTKLGNPLYVTGTVTFTTYRDLKASEYNNLFLKNS